MDAAHPERQALRARHPVVWYGIVYGVISGVVVAAAGAGKVIQGDEALAVAGAGVAAVCYLLAGAFAAGRGYSARAGLEAGLLAGPITAVIGVPVDLICTRVFMSAYLPHMEIMQSSPGGRSVVLTPAMVFGFEVLGMTYLAVGAIVAGGALGWLGGFFGASTHLGWPLAEKPALRATVPAEPPPGDDVPAVPSGPHWELAHSPSPPADKP